MDLSPLVLPAALFTASWVGGNVLYQAALAALRAEWGSIPFFMPYRMGMQRALTALEVRAERQTMRRFTKPVPDPADLRPPWVRILGVAVDALFVAAAFLLFRHLFGISSGFFTAVVVYMALGAAAFFYQVTVQGQIGRVGYHIRFLISLVAWPALLFFR